MENDLQLSLATIDTGPNGQSGRLLRQIEHAQQHMLSGWNCREWAKRLRFLVDVRSDYPGCGPHFKLISEEIDSPEGYVAVSYCWRGSDSKYSKDDTTFLIEIPNPGAATGGGPPTMIRKARARSEVLIRSFMFASSKGIRKVWIDQECIEQDDRMDKELGIQSMDLVYRSARFTVVLLGQHIQSIQDAATILVLSHPSGFYDMSDHPTANSRDLQFQSRYGHVGSPLHPDLRLSDDEFRRLIGAFSAVGKVLGDKWFTRAWTTQEHIVSGQGCILFMLSWDEDVDPAGKPAHQLWAQFHNEFSAGNLRPFGVTRHGFGISDPKVSTDVDTARAEDYIHRQTVPGEWLLTEEEVMDLAHYTNKLNAILGDTVDTRLDRYGVKHHATLVPWVAVFENLGNIGAYGFARQGLRRSRARYYTLEEVQVSPFGQVEPMYVGSFIL